MKNKDYKLNIENFVEQFKEKYDIENLRNQLKNVYFIIGTAYAGKSTMIKMLSNHFDGIMCKENYTIDVFEKYGVNPSSHPNLCFTKTMKDWEEFIGRTPEEYVSWIRGSEMESTPIEISELIKLTQKSDRKIFVDTSIPLEILKLISGYDNVAVMLCDQSMSINNFFDRSYPEKRFILNKIEESKNPNAMDNYRKILEKMNSTEIYNKFLNSGFYVFKRDDSLTLEQTMEILAQHFKL